MQRFFSWSFGLRPTSREESCTVEEFFGGTFPVFVPWKTKDFSPKEKLIVWLYQHMEPRCKNFGSFAAAGYEKLWEQYQKEMVSPLPESSFREEFLEIHYTISFVLCRQEALWTSTIDRMEPTQEKKEGFTWEYLSEWYYSWQRRWLLADSPHNWGLFLRQVRSLINERRLHDWDWVTYDEGPESR